MVREAGQAMNAVLEWVFNWVKEVIFVYFVFAGMVLPFLIMAHFGGIRAKERREREDLEDAIERRRMNRPRL